METIRLTGYAAAATLYAFPTDKSLADWATYRVLFAEGTGADAGRYSASVDTANGIEWVAFAGATQPAGWDEALAGVEWNLSSLIGKELLEADQVLAEDAGVQKLRTYKRGTATEIIPAKTAKQPSGANLTDPQTQLLGGYRE